MKKAVEDGRNNYCDHSKKYDPAVEGIAAGKYLPALSFQNVHRPHP